MNENVNRELIRAFGPEAGLRIAVRVLPNIMKDFEKMLSGAKAGAAVSEEYRFDDIRGSIRLYGSRGFDGKVHMTGLSVNGGSTVSL